MSLLELYEQKINKREKSLLELVEEKIGIDSHKLNIQSTPAKSPNPFLYGKPDVTAFNKWAESHRTHQQDAIDAATNNNNGQIIIPTGTGKTRIQVHIHVSDMIRKSDMNQTGVYVIGAHRLLLCAQLMDDLRDLCIQCKVPINVLYVGSARHDDKVVYDRYFNHGITRDTFESSYTTTMDDIKEFYKKTRSQNRHLIVVSTYHSFDRLSILDTIDICTYDEAHTTLAEDFSDNIEIVRPKIQKNYFFTATRKVRGDEFGMNDTDTYGELLCAVSPRKMIESGEIVTPKLHIMQLADDSKELVSQDDQTMLVKTVIDGFKEHKARLKDDSASPSQIGAKLLVSCKGSTELKLIQDSTTFKNWCISNNVKLFSFSSRYGNYQDFEEEQNRTKVYESLRTLKDEENAIFLHIDILTEGIDLPSITAVMLLRHLNTAKLMQTLGRALRLLKTDRMKLYNGTMTPKDKQDFIKPYAYVMLPMHFETLNASSIEMKVTLRRIISEYGIPTEEFLPLNEFQSKAEQDTPDTVTDKIKEKNKKSKEYPLLHLIEEFIFDKFGEKLPEDKMERYLDLTSLLKEEEGENDA